MTPEEAYEYAKKHGPSDETREIACKKPRYAFLYARDVDKCPREDTRNAACKESKWAYWYVKEVDGSFHEETWLVIYGTEYEEEYRRMFGGLFI